MAKSPAAKKRIEDLMASGLMRSDAVRIALLDEKFGRLTKGGKLRGQKQSKPKESEQEDQEAEGGGEAAEASGGSSLEHGETEG